LEIADLHDIRGYLQAIGLEGLLGLEGDQRIEAVMLSLGGQGDPEP
jgi:hypothetical protein